MPEFSSSKIINHCFHVNNDKGESSIGHGMITGRDLIVQLGLTVKFKRQLLQWYGSTVNMKEPKGLLGQYDPNKRNIREVVMQTAEPASTTEATGRMDKILDSTYVKAYLKHVSDNATRLNADNL